VARAGHGDEEAGKGSLARQARYSHAPFCQMTRGAPSRIACPDAERGDAQSHMETLIIYKLASMKFTIRTQNDLSTQNDLYELYECKRVVILIETKLINYKCFHMKSFKVPCSLVPDGPHFLLRSLQRPRQHEERSAIYCQKNSISVAHATHCAPSCTPCRPLIRAFSGWILTPPPKASTNLVRGVGYGNRFRAKREQLEKSKDFYLKAKAGIWP
jgi:hypothetical protein